MINSEQHVTVKKNNKYRHMKKILIYSLIILLGACAHAPNKENSEAKSNISALDIEEIIPEKFAFENITTLKLQEYFDLLVLEKKHPEFKKELELQIRKMANFNFPIDSLSTNIKIKNIKQIGNLVRVSDTSQRLKISFDINTTTSSKNDSIAMLVHSKTILIDTQEMTTTQVVFEKIN